MNVINALGFFFTSFGRVLELLGAVLLIGLPSLALGMRIGWRLKKGREPSELRVAIENRKRAESLARRGREAVERSLRYIRSAEAIDGRAVGLRRSAEANRNLAIEILSKSEEVMLELVEIDEAE